MDLLLLTQWIIILVVALLALVRGADVFVGGAKSLGIYFGFRPFLVGVLIIGLGTSLPELASSLAAVWQGTTEIVVANVVGSNITNILLIGGLLAAFGGNLIIKQELIKTELPLFVIATVHFLAAVHNGVIERPEAVLLLGTLGAYFWYLIKSNQEEESVHHRTKVVPEFTRNQSWFWVVVGGLAVIVGAHYTIAMLLNIAEAFAISIGVLTIVIIALGTSLPELSVSWQALKRGEADMVIGNIFGSNAFNLLLVASVPALLIPITADAVVMDFGLVILIAASVIFFVNGLAKHIMQWEGVMMLLFYGFLCSIYLILYRIRPHRVCGLVR